MLLEVLTPEKKIYSGEVYGVQLPGVEGLFEILENHAPMVAALGEGKMKLIFDKAGKSEIYHINGGFVETSNNKTSVVLESAVITE